MFRVRSNLPRNVKRTGWQWFRHTKWAHNIRISIIMTVRNWEQPNANKIRNGNDELQPKKNHQSPIHFELIRNVRLYFLLSLRHICLLFFFFSFRCDNRWCHIGVDSRPIYWVLVICFAISLLINKLKLYHRSRLLLWRLQKRGTITKRNMLHSQSNLEDDSLQPKQQFQVFAVHLHKVWIYHLACRTEYQFWISFFFFLILCFASHWNCMLSNLGRNPSANERKTLSCLGSSLNNNFHNYSTSLHGICHAGTTIAPLVRHMLWNPFDVSVDEMLWRRSLKRVENVKEMRPLLLNRFMDVQWIVLSTRGACISVDCNGVGMSDGFRRKNYMKNAFIIIVVEKPKLDETSLLRKYISKWFAMQIGSIDLKAKILSSRFKGVPLAFFA